MASNVEHYRCGKLEIEVRDRQQDGSQPTVLIFHAGQQLARVPLPASQIYVAGTMACAGLGLQTAIQGVCGCVLGARIAELGEQRDDGRWVIEQLLSPELKQWPSAPPPPDAAVVPQPSKPAVRSRRRKP